MELVKWIYCFWGLLFAGFEEDLVAENRDVFCCWVLWFCVGDGCQQVVDWACLGRVFVEFVYAGKAEEALLLRLYLSPWPHYLIIIIKNS